MKTPRDVLDIFFTELNSTHTVFRGGYPDGFTADKFIVINTLGVPKDSIQEVEVNVNCYAKDFTGGIMDEVGITDMAADAIDDLHGYHWKEGSRVFIEFQSMAPLREESMGMHYMNARFKLTYLNN